MEHGPQLSDVHTTSKSDAKISTKRNEATRWLRKSVGVVAAKDLPAEPSEQNFRMGLRSGLILCSALNKSEPDSIPKVTFFVHLLISKDHSITKGGRLSRVVNCVLALKAYSEWKKADGNGTFRYVGNRKPSSTRKQMVCKSLDMHTCRNLWKQSKDKIVEIVLTKLIEDFEQKLAIHKEQTKLATKTKPVNKIELNIKMAPPEEVKQSPRNIFKEMESKSREPFKKEEFIKKSFSSIMNEMRKKASGDTDKPYSDIIKKIEMNVTSDTMKSTSDINNKIEKNVTADTMKPDSDITNAIKKNVTTNTMKPDSDINNAIKKNVATDTMKSTSDVNNKMVEKLTKEAMISTTRDVNKVVEENATMDSTMDDVNDEMKDDDDLDDDDDLNYEIEEDTTIDSITDDVDDEMEEDTTVSEDDEDEEEDEVPADGEDYSSCIFDELEKKKKMERKIEQKKKEIEKIKEQHKKKEMEREIEMEKKRDIRKQREMERKKEMEKKAAEDAKEEKYYNWVNSEHERLTRSNIKQQKMVEHQHKELQV
ncbi:hypothetical protein L1987_83380 [Smallanthus sonchifolius]|uniref:Uncharacterized protein n=1 Tax=Smallanthus sonchifolius TaxID=185202 RepID=A0ACB8YC32_9ASTR|nr:hypothetical protein L1987_83380 [Smallanthus sonchifolius]